MNKWSDDSVEEQEAWSVPRFVEELRELKRHAGSPALARIRRHTKNGWGITTLHDLFAGKGKLAPNWELVDDVVQALTGCAREKNRELDPLLVDRGRWLKRHLLLQTELERTRSEESDHRKRLLDQFSVFPVDQMERPPFHTLRELIERWNGTPAPSAGLYLPRPDSDEELRLALATAVPPYPFLLVYGDEGVGKSTSAWTAIAETLGPETRVLVSRDASAITDFVRARDVPMTMTEQILIWTDGLTSPDLDGLSRETLELLAEKAFFVATISADECAAIVDAPRGYKSNAKAALKRAYLVHLSWEPEISEIVQTAGLNEAESELAELGADSHLAWIRLNTGRSQSPSGVAIVRAIIDFRRAGLMRPVLDEELIQIFPIYLAEIADIAVSDEIFAAGMAWAQRPAPNTPPMICSRIYRGRPSWIISDQLRDDKASWKLPDTLWPVLVRILDPHECFYVAQEANEHGEFVYAKEALVKAATVPENAARATLLIGHVFEKLGDLSAAKVALMEVVESGASDEASAAAHRLGSIFRKEGDFGQAIEYWTLATQWSGASALLAWFELGHHYAKVGDREKAIAALDRDFSNPLVSSLVLSAKTLLSLLRASVSELQARLEEWEAGGNSHGRNPDVVPALREYIKFAESGEGQTCRSELDPIDIDTAMAEGRRRRGMQDFPGALNFYLHLAASEQLDFRAAALYEAGITAMDMGLIDRAMEAYEESVRCAQPYHSAQAALSLGSLLCEKETPDFPGAIRAWTDAEKLGDRETRAKAAFNIGVAYDVAHRYPEAVVKLQSAMDLADSGFKARVALMLAQVHESMGSEYVIVDEFYYEAANVDESRFSLLAAVALAGRILEREGPVPEVERLARLAYKEQVPCEEQDPEVRGKGAWLLGYILEAREDTDAAIRAYEAAIETRHADWATAANCSLGLLHGTQDRKHTGVKYLREAYRSGHPEHRLEAGFWIGMFYLWDGTHGKPGSLESALIMLREVAESGHPKWAKEASLVLDQI
ncbi:hypothetical protein [Micromonospora sp. WMMD714]|uniref:tetratricopeptide repeat protein n=1 Tax=Micromonospora sp. WMMD714 TaxID=3016097 RepID=UPI00249AC1CE|nr:hypothetical protein [Micromonospora sp. WMMD714]WFE63377.1 hypothetical protein O7625_08815 [Micromonospora sp. WMMD714]